MSLAGMPARDACSWIFSGLDLTTMRVSFEASEEYFFHVTGFKP